MSVKSYNPDDAVVTFNGIKFLGAMCGDTEFNHNISPSTEFDSWVQRMWDVRTVGNTLELRPKALDWTSCALMPSALTSDNEDEEEFDEDEDDEDYDEDEDDDDDDEDSDEDGDDEDEDEDEDDDDDMRARYDHFIIDDPIDKPVTIHYYACTSLTCPRREPVVEAQKCYTCGEPYSMVTYTPSYTSIENIGVEARLWTWKRLEGFSADHVLLKQDAVTPEQVRASRFSSEQKPVITALSNVRDSGDGVYKVRLDPSNTTEMGWYSLSYYYYSPPAK